VKNRRPAAGAEHLLHSFSQDQKERRQYRRVEVQFPLWWLKDSKGSVPGIGIEVSGGGLQFLLEHRLDEKCSLAFQITDRRMRANIMTVQSADFAHEGRDWQRYRAKFVGLLEADFHFIIAFTDNHAKHTAAAFTDNNGKQPDEAALRPLQPPVRDTTGPKMSVGSLESFDMLPTHVQEEIVQMLVDMKRLVSPRGSRLALLGAHYGGIQGGNNGENYHRFFIRTRVNLDEGHVVYNTEVLVSDDGLKVLVRE
jgi:hypothetical protein